MTRGPSSTLETLKFEAGLGAYAEDEPVHLLHGAPVRLPEASRRSGRRTARSTPEDLKRPGRLRQAAGQSDILGNQQSFGHFGSILQHPEYADAARDARHPLPGQGGDLQAAGRHVLARSARCCRSRCSTSAATRPTAWATGRRRSWPRRSASAASTSGTSAASTTC